MIRELTSWEVVEQYCEQILAGEIPACQMVVKAVEKFQNELAIQGTVDFPYVLNHQEAALACEFFPALLRHSIGKWAGLPFDLSPWQLFIHYQIFGWLKPDDTRRFRRVFLSVGRKNGKSSYCAGLTLQLGTGDGEQGAQVFIGATKIDQARIIFQESNRMVRQSPFIAKHATVHKDNIAFHGSNSFIRPLSSDRPFDGLNPSAFICDEIHAFREHQRPFWDTLTTGSGARTQPLQVTITTAGSETSLIYHEESKYARGVITGDIIDPSVFAMIFELDKDDDPFDDGFNLETMIKANPNYGISVSPEELQQQITEARSKPSAKYRFDRYRANRCVTSVERAITADIWDGAAGELSDWQTADAVGFGVDLGGRDDLAAFGMVARFPIGKGRDGIEAWRFEAKAVCFIAADTKRDLNAEPYRTWIADGKLLVAEYVVTELRERLIEDAMALRAQYIAYDPHQATLLSEELEREGFIPVKMLQNQTHFNEVLLEYWQAFSEGRFKPDENDLVLRWCALNMSVNRNNRDAAMPDKLRSADKIDGIVAVLMGLKALNVSPSRTKGSLVL